MPKAKRNSTPSAKRRNAPRGKAKSRTPCANDNEETLWRPLPGYPHSEYIDVLTLNYRLVRR